MTNADRIRNMTNSELAEFIYNVSNGATKISTCDKECAKCEYSEDYCTYQIGEWLIKLGNQKKMTNKQQKTIYKTRPKTYVYRDSLMGLVQHTWIP